MAADNAPRPPQPPRKPTKVQSPFLAQKRHLARGSPAPPHPALRALVQWTLVALISSSLLSRTVTESWFWGKDFQVARAMQRYKETALLNLLGSSYAKRERVLSVAELEQYNGSNAALPIYLAIDGNVYDVTAGRRTYGPGGSYHFFAGRDAARAFVTGCFNEHLTHDLRGLTTKQLEGLAHWKKFFAESDKYTYVGRLASPPIDPASPVPADCHAPAG